MASCWHREPPGKGYPAHVHDRLSSLFGLCILEAPVYTEMIYSVEQWVSPDLGELFCDHERNAESGFFIIRYTGR